MFAEHGHFQKKFNKKWIEKIQKDSDWKKNFLPIFQDFTDRTPGTFIEEKSNCIVWHYRKTDPELANDRVVELKTVVNSLISENLIMMDGDKAIEITNVNINKGSAVNSLLNEKEYDFVYVGQIVYAHRDYLIHLPLESYDLEVTNPIWTITDTKSRVDMMKDFCRRLARAANPNGEGTARR